MRDFVFEFQARSEVAEEFVEGAFFEVKIGVFACLLDGGMQGGEREPEGARVHGLGDVGVDAGASEIDGEGHHGVFRDQSSRGENAGADGPGEGIEALGDVVAQISGIGVGVKAEGEGISQAGGAAAVGAVFLKGGGGPAVAETDAEEFYGATGIGIGMGHGGDDALPWIGGAIVAEATMGIDGGAEDEASHAIIGAAEVGGYACVGEGEAEQDLSEAIRDSRVRTGQGAEDRACGAVTGCTIERIHPAVGGGLVDFYLFLGVDGTEE